VYLILKLFLETLILIMIEIQYSSTALLLLGNPCIPYQNNGTIRPSYINCLKRRWPAMFNPLYSSMNQQLLKNTFYNQSTPMKIKDNFCSHHVPTTKSTLYAVSKDEWDKKEGPGNSMKYALYVQQCGKRYNCRVEQWKNQTCSLGYCWVMQVWRHQAGRQLVIC